MDIEAVREYCLSRPCATEDMRFGEAYLCFAVFNKIFACYGFERENYFVVKCDPDIRQYHGNSFTLPPTGKVTVPTAFAQFPHDILPVPRIWVEGMYPLIQYTEMSYGGHFTAMENPQEFSTDLATFISKVETSKQQTP